MLRLGLLRMCARISRILHPPLLMTTLHRRIPFFRTSTNRLYGWWAVTRVTLIMTKVLCRRRWVLGVSVTGVVLVVRGDVYCFVMLHIGC
jgi:hypothetical protein